ncbi:MAG: cupin domain-containing protein [Syntrophomonadaceae bacterium]|nr:cupin domain-containing protein [Syntrophomonadaceae bacterium]
MPRPELELFDVNTLAWTQVQGAPPGLMEKILSKDPDTGSYTRLLKFPPGMVTTERLVHDFWEEVYILQGGLVDLTSNQIFMEGFYACRPPGMLHGPYSVPVGCITLEMRYFV